MTIPAPVTVIVIMTLTRYWGGGYLFITPPSIVIMTLTRPCAGVSFAVPGFATFALEDRLGLGLGCWVGNRHLGGPCSTRHSDDLTHPSPVASATASSSADDSTTLSA